VPVSTTINTQGTVFTRHGTVYNSNKEYHTAKNYGYVQTFDAYTSQRTQYYPSGLPWESNTGDNTGTQPYKYNGKEFVETHGFNAYDSQARWYYPDMIRTMTVDPLAEKYYSISPYAYCGNNPINNIDLRGDSITVLNKGYETAQHMGLLIQNDTGKWQYFSFNGDAVYNATNGLSGGKPYHDMGEKAFNSPQEFLESTYNAEGNKKQISDNTVNNYGFTEGYVFPTTPEQDNIIRNTFTDISQNENYSLGLIQGSLPNQCANVTQRSLNAAGIKTTITVTTGTIRWGEDFRRTRTFQPYLPSEAYKAIVRNNSNGFKIYGTKE
jgi:RHS repeat-associated protein